jgi:thiol-disulfide isomerase/thioredoxin
MADKYTKVQPKVHPFTISAIIGFIVIVVALIIVLQPSEKETIYNSYELYATNDFTEDHPFTKVEYKSSLFNKGLDKIIPEEELVLVYIGAPSCTSCQAHIGAFQKYYEELNFSEYVDEIKYYDPSLNLTQFENFRTAYEGVADTTPQLIMFQNGEILYQFEVVSAEDTQLLNRSVRDFYEEVIDLLDA